MENESVVDADLKVAAICYGLCLKQSSEILGEEIATVTDEEWAPESGGDPKT